MAAPKSVLIVGGSGFLGTHFALRLRERFKVFATYHSRPIRMKGVTFLPAKVGNRNWLKRMVYTVAPDVVIYAAGSPDVARAEANAREAEAIHSGGPASILNVAEVFQPRFIYVSSCQVFDGQKGNFRETDVVLPDTVIGRAKVGAENYVRGKSLNYVIVRLSPILGRGNGYNLSFLDRLRMRLDRGERVELPASELHSFAPIPGLTDLMAKLVEAGPRNRILHYGGLTKLSWFELGQAFAERGGYDPKLITSGRPANPSDYSLNSSLATETLKIKPLLLEEGFDLIEQQLVARP